MSMLFLLLLFFQGDIKQPQDPVPAASEGLQKVTFPDMSSAEPIVQEQFRDVRKELVEAVKADPRDVLAIRDAYMKLGRTFHAYDRLAEARVCYTNAGKLSADRFDTYYLSADLARLMGENEAAQKLYERAAVLLPTYHSVYIRLGDLALGRHDLETAVNYYQEALRRMPQEPAGYFGLGKTALEKKDYDVAIQYLEKALEMVPDADRLNYLLGMAWRNKGDMEKAKTYLVKAGKRGIKPMDNLANNLVQEIRSGRIHITRGKTAFAAKDYAGAAAEFTQAAIALPNDPGPLINMGGAYAALNQLDKAEVAFRKALEIDPKAVTALYNLGIITLQKGNGAEALTLFEKTVSLNPKDGSARLQLAALLKKAGRIEESFRQYDITAEMEPNNEEAQLQRAYILIQTNQPKEAMKRLTADYDRNPTFGRLAHLYARYLAATPDLSLRDGEKAVSIAASVVNAAPTAEHLETLAMAYAQTDNCEEALNIQTKAMEAAQKTGNQRLQQRIQADLTRYQKGAPCRP